MRFVSIRALAALTLLLGILAATTAGAVQPQLLPDHGSLITPKWMPIGLEGPLVTVMVELAGAPVAIHQASAGRKLAPAEKERIKSELGPAHDAVSAGIEQLGGTILGHYKSAYNGIKVRIARDRVDPLRTLPGVIGVHPIQLMRPTNIHGIPLIGAPLVWGSLGFHGEGVKIAMIDTGIDYTHADFGGPGTVAAYNLAHMNEALPADPALFGPNAPRVKGGTDLVGDSYDADPNDTTYQPVPHPDPNPLDCNGHGSHTAGTAAGSGVTAAGATYTGPYNATTVAGNSWTVGPGAAPKADIYAIRVFGCNGSSDVVVDAIDWAVDNDMDVISMSLGSSFGTSDDSTAAASTNAALAGIVVVAAAGNDTQSPYIVATPATADGAIAVAAIDPIATFPGANLLLSTGPTILTQDSNGVTFADGTSYPVAVLRTSYPDGPVALGCSQAEYAAFPGFPASLVGKLIVTARNTCSRVARPIFAQMNGAAASAMINNGPGYPPFEGAITGAAETGPFNVTIPFFGVLQSDGDTLAAADAGTAMASNVIVPNPDYLALASFSSAGPRSGDSFLKPDLSAPGVSIISALVGSGNGATTDTGTSMATPHVAGSAALTRQAHPTWNAVDIKAALVNTGFPAGVAGYVTSVGGTGLVQPAKATLSQVVARSAAEPLSVALNFGYAELGDDFSEQQVIALTNNGSVDATFTVAEALPAGVPHSVSFSGPTVTVPAGGIAEVGVQLDVPVANVPGDTTGGGPPFNEVVGLVEFTPATPSDNAGVTLRVPYYFVPHANADVSATIGELKGTNPSTRATVTNPQGPLSGNADFYAWGLAGQNADSPGSNVVRAVGTQSFPFPGGDQLIVFAVNTFKRWSNASVNEFDIGVDVDGDGVDDYIIVGADSGAVTIGAFTGQMGSFVFSTRSAGASSNFSANAPTDRSVVELPVLASQLCRTGEPCLSAANPRITYHITGFDLVNGGQQAVTGFAKFNPFSTAISTGGFVTVMPGTQDSSTVIAVKSTEWLRTPALGLMIVTFDNPSGADEAQLIKANVLPEHQGGFGGD